MEFLYCFSQFGARFCHLQLTEHGCSSSESPQLRRDLPARLLTPPPHPQGWQFERETKGLTGSFARPYNVPCRRKGLPQVR